MNTELIRNNVDKIEYLQKTIKALQEAHSDGKSEDIVLMIDHKPFALGVIPSNDLYPLLLNIFTEQITKAEKEIKHSVNARTGTDYAAEQG